MKRAADALKCAKCGSATEIVDSRPGPSDTVRRRRRCIICGHRWSTYEIPAAVIRRHFAALRKAIRPFRALHRVPHVKGQP